MSGSIGLFKIGQSQIAADLPIDTFVSAPIADGPDYRAFSITPSNSTVFTAPTRELWVGGGGAVAVLLNGDTSPVTLAGVVTGTKLSVSATKVMATNTTATNIVGLY